MVVKLWSCWKIEHYMVKKVANTICHQIKRKKKHQDFIMDDILPHVTTFYLLSLFWRKIGEVKISEILFTTVHKWVPYHFQILHIKNSRLKFTKYWFLNSGVSNSKCERSVLDIQPLKTNTRTHISFLVNGNSDFSSKRCYARFT